jgi:hypothetical protein
LLTAGPQVITLTAIDADGLEGTAEINIVIIAALDVVSYDGDIQPYFNTNCIGCHDTTVQQAGVRLDSWAETLTPGDNGATVVPLDSTQGTLMSQLNAAHMGAPHGTDIVDLTAQWIDDGAEDN